MSGHDGFLSLGDAFDLWDADWTGWAYLARKTEQRLIGNGTDAGNVVIQEGSKGYREGTLVFTAQDSTQKDLVRAYEEDSTSVNFVDYDTSICSVQLLSFASADEGADLWTVTVRLLQLSDPVIPGP